MQKNEQKHETIIHGRTDDPGLCPVKQWAHLVNRIWSYQGTTENTPVSTVWRHDRREQITSRQAITSLRAACATIGSARLGFEPDEIGTHSLRSGAAMEMYLAGIPVYTIIDRSERSPTLHLELCQMKIPGSATIETTPRLGEILDATRLDGCNYRLSLFSTNQPTTQKQLMEEASSFRSLKGVGRGES